MAKIIGIDLRTTNSVASVVRGGENQVNEVRQAMGENDVGRIKQLSETLEQMVHSLSQQIYATQPEGGQDRPKGQEGDGTVEDECREVWSSW